MICCWRWHRDVERDVAAASAASHCVRPQRAREWESESEKKKKKQSSLKTHLSCHPNKTYGKIISFQSHRFSRSRYFTDGTTVDRIQPPAMIFHQHCFVSVISIDLFSSFLPLCFYFIFDFSLFILFVRFFRCLRRFVSSTSVQRCSKLLNRSSLRS